MHVPRFGRHFNVCVNVSVNRGKAGLAGSRATHIVRGRGSKGPSLTLPHHCLFYCPPISLCSAPGNPIYKNAIKFLLDRRLTCHTRPEDNPKCASADDRTLWCGPMTYMASTSSAILGNDLQLKQHLKQKMRVFLDSSLVRSSGLGLNLIADLPALALALHRLRTRMLAHTGAQSTRPSN